jgi:hypothetical protein
MLADDLRGCPTPALRVDELFAALIVVASHALQLEKITA